MVCLGRVLVITWLIVASGTASADEAGEMSTCLQAQLKSPDAAQQESSYQKGVPLALCMHPCFASCLSSHAHILGPLGCLRFGSVASVR